MRSVAFAGALLLAIPLSAQTSQPPTHPVAIPEGTALTVETREEVSSKTAAQGDAVELMMSEPAAIENEIVVAKGASVKGSVAAVKRAGRMGRAGSMSLKIISVSAMDGQRIPLRGSKASAGKDHLGATVALTMLLTPLGLLKHGNDALYKTGTRMTVYTDSTVTIAVPSH